MKPHNVRYRKSAQGLDVVEVYSHQMLPKEHVVTERTRIERGSDVIDIFCQFNVTPAGYNAVEITIHRNQELEYEWTLTRAQMLAFAEQHREQVPQLETLLLVDGPNPMFNLFNARILAGEPRGRPATINVLQLRYQTKSMHIEQYQIIDTDDMLMVDQGRPGAIVEYHGLGTGQFPTKILEGTHTTYVRI